MKSQNISRRQDDHLLTRQSLLCRVQNGQDENAWEEFEKIYQPFLTAFLRKHSIPESECEDISQEVMIKLYKNIEQYQKRNGAKFRTWLFTIIRNTTFSHLKKRKLNQDRDEKWAKEKMRLFEGNDLEETYNIEWQEKVCEMAFETVKKKFSGKAIDVFLQTLDNIPVEKISENLNIKRDSVYRLRGRVKKAITQEVQYLREQLE